MRCDVGGDGDSGDVIGAYPSCIEVMNLNLQIVNDINVDGLIPTITLNVAPAYP